VCVVVFDSIDSGEGELPLSWGGVLSAALMHADKLAMVLDMLAIALSRQSRA